MVRNVQQPLLQFCWKSSRAISQKLGLGLGLFANAAWWRYQRVSFCLTAETLWWRHNSEWNGVSYFRWTSSVLESLTCSGMLCLKKTLWSFSDSPDSLRIGSLFVPFGVLLLWRSSLGPGLAFRIVWELNWQVSVLPASLEFWSVFPGSCGRSWWTHGSTLVLE